MNVDATIEAGEVPKTIRYESVLEDGLIVGENEILVTIDGVARYLVQRGEHIVVQPEAAAADELVRVFLYGAGFSTLLQQRRLMPLHASAVAMGERAIAFCGPTGHGKSTLAAAFSARGHTVLCDDKLVLRATSEGVFACPGPPTLSLFPAAAQATGQSRKNRVSDREKFGKHCYLAPAANASAKLPLTHVFLMKWAQDGGLDIRPLPPFESLIELRQNLNLGTLIGPLGIEADFMRWSQVVLSQVRFFELHRPKDFRQMDKVLDRVIAHVGK